MSKHNLKEVGAYTPTEAAHYLQVPISTLRAWILGQTYESHGKVRHFKPVVQIADKKDKLLSFYNLVEIHALSVIKTHNVKLPEIRKGLDYVEKELSTRRPLLNQKFLTDGIDLFVEHFGSVLNVTKDGQTSLKEIAERYLHRVVRDSSGLPIKLYPFSRHAGAPDARKIVIDPTIAFGKPVLVGTGVSTANVFDRFSAGEPLGELAADFNVDVSLIEEAIRCEQVRKATA